MDYLGTISDETLGYVKCIAASVVDGKIRLVTGGSELRVWNETSNGKKRRARYVKQYLVLIVERGVEVFLVIVAQSLLRQ